MNNLLEWLQQIYEQDFCNGDWEHIHGVTIDTIDSPGWYFKFDLKDTDLENENFNEVFFKEDDRNWYQCWKKEGVFHGWGGANNLSDILAVFREWYLTKVELLDEGKHE